MNLNRFHIVLFALVLVMTGCKKKQLFLDIAIKSYSDDFEQYSAIDSTFFAPDRWDFFQLTVAGNTMDIDSQIVHSGNQALRCYANGTTDQIVSKATIQKQGIGWQQGDTIRFEGYFYIEGNLENLFILDIEESASISYSPGIRLMFSKEGYLMVERGKMNMSTIQQKSGQEIAWPKNQWVKLTYEVLFSQRKKGYVKLWQNNQAVLEAHNIKTMPKDILYYSLGTSDIYSNFEIGITANGGNKPSTLYLDDFSVWKK